jgi:hypothetical protein
MTKVSPQDTVDAFIGSGALSYSWWRVGDFYGTNELTSPEDWYLVLTEVGDDGEPGESVRVDHTTVMRAVNKLARTALADRPRYMAETVIRECRNLISDPDDADFDADSADQVLQFMMFGEVVYG